MLNEFLRANHEEYLIENAEYQILRYVLEDEKLKLLEGLDQKIYMELIDLKVRLGDDGDEGEPVTGSESGESVAEEMVEENENPTISSNL